jgi:O-antigen/teichoic acid export membrane protein
MSILIIAVNYWLIPIYGIEGAAIGSASVMLAFNLIKYGYLKIKLHLDPFSYETLKILFVGVMIFVLRDFYLDGVHPLLMAGIKSILIVGMFFFWSMIANVGQDEWNWIKSKLKKSGP